ncbi:nose resistant to fluoxetine protein 6-like [Daphnia pulex]|uniref:nose resistant to fluoxetine protein 6-like n=1 Tax=Daphnia pulex TaxID=6669 RepID=UPI001EDD3453|nr:nose resistant to fluoxetine protein 6-like [Daphnia pulex]
MGSMLWKITFLLLWVGGQSQQFINPALIISPESERSFEKWRNIISQQLQESGSTFDLTSTLHNVFAALKSSSFPTAVAKNISQQCLQDSQYYVHNLYANQSLWALQMQESSAKLPPGLFGSRNIHADGLFDECLAVRAPGFDGQYCSVYFQPVAVDQSEILPPRSFNENHEGRRNFVTIFQLLGLLGSDRVEPKVSVADASTYIYPSTTFCLPSSCSAADLGQAVAELIGSYVIANYSIVTVTDEQYCFKENNDPPTFDGATITVIVVLSLVGIFVLMATIHEAWRMYRGTDFDAKQDGKLLSALHCFSILNNGRKILSMKVTASSSNDNFGCIHGIRFFSTCWVVIGHTFGIAAAKIMNRKAVTEDFRTLGMQTIGNASVSVDTFFLMSGLLVSFLLLRELDRNKGKFNVGLYYLHRYLRLTIVYAFILGFIATLIVYFGIGPNWYDVNKYSNACRLAWWRQFLYINNLFPLNADYACMGQTWYLAVDMQLFIFSPLFIYPLWRWRKWGLVWLAAVALICQGVIFFIYARDDLSPTLWVTRADDLATTADYYDHYYVKPWTRAPVYLVGIWAGWFLHVTKQSQGRLAKPLVVLGWILSAAVGLAIVYGLAPYVDPSKVPEVSSLLKMTYGPLHRTAWAFVITWIIFACSRGYGGIVNRLLSWKGFLPLGRVTYCVYLIHYDFLVAYYSAMRKRFYYTLFEQFTVCFGLLVMTFGIAFLVSVTLEASFLNLEKLIFSSKSKSKPREEITAPPVDEKTNAEHKKIEA